MTAPLAQVRNDAAPGSVAGAPEPWAQSTAGFGMFVYLASDIMLFASFFAAYFLLRSTNEPWPPADVQLDTGRTMLATSALVASSVSLQLGHRGFERTGNPRSLLPWLYATIALGAVFLGNQLAEYRTLPFSAGDHPYGSIYWMLTGLHGAHVAAGLGILGLLVVRAARVREAQAMVAWLRGTSAFWHLVDVIWLAVFATIWLLR